MTNIRTFALKKKYLRVPHIGHQYDTTVYLTDIWQKKKNIIKGQNVFY